ncbi:pectinacetylesterase family protein [Striga asiatica]|uniref:Pectinacetylesterase family protein n=1 Tax=Striga asiatica TaxID=4170 RepID=A0A5A7Q422_STRAF|nr:pectinacetylesterase family protein [Striga asiatica]
MLTSTGQLGWPPAEPFRGRGGANYQIESGQSPPSPSPESPFSFSFSRQYRCLDGSVLAVVRGGDLDLALMTGFFTLSVSPSLVNLQSDIFLRTHLTDDCVEHQVQFLGILSHDPLQNPGMLFIVGDILILFFNLNITFVFGWKQMAVYWITISSMNSKVDFSLLVLSCDFFIFRLFNWNKVKIRCCDGSSFSSHPDYEYKVILKKLKSLCTSLRSLCKTMK